jgi:hypothetical protein
MSVLLKQRGAQYPLTTEFVFNFSDTMVNTAGVSGDFKSVAAPAFDVIGLPANSIITGGDIVVETAYAGPTVATVSVGDSASAARYLAATTLLSAGRTALVPTGFNNVDALPVRITFSITVAAATAGKAVVRVTYITRDKTNEVVHA